MGNRLAQETSPYLLEHADNPVDWYPWGPEALAKARNENKPILLSIGYSACHWCHVMAHESFEDSEVATLMNRDFVSIKVDREERPDLDQVYMRAVQGLTGSGGWPMTVFLLPDGTPFFAGTYFPPIDRFGMPSFRRVLSAVAEAFSQRPAEVEATGAQVRDFLERPVVPLAAGTLTPALLDEAYTRLRRDHDPNHGGFGGAPKFPQPMLIEFLLRTSVRTGEASAQEMAKQTLRAMADGGMYDQLAGGFHRYSVDERWLVPHFEKMLYDNALLARAYLDAWQLTREPLFRRVLDRPDLVQVAETNARFLLSRLRDRGRMRRGYKDGRATVAGYLEDQAAVADGLLSLYAATFEVRWLEEARVLLEEMLIAFWDDGRAAFFDTAADHERLVVRPQDVTDNAIPSGTSMAVDVLLRAGTLLGQDPWVAKAHGTLERLAPTAAKAPLAFGRLLAALDFHLGRPVELAVIGAPAEPGTRRFLDVVRSRFFPNLLVAVGTANGSARSVPLLADRPAIGPGATAYLCEGFACPAPTTDPAELDRQLDRVLSQAS